MKKYRFHLIVFVLCLITTKASFAQWSVGTSVTYLNLLVKDGYGNFGLSLKAEKNMLYFGFAYAAKASGSRTVLADTAVLEKGQAEALSTYSLKSYKLFIGVKNYFIGAYDEDFGFYGLVDIGYYYMPITRRLEGPVGEARYYRHVLFGVSKEREESFVESNLSETLVTGGVGLGVEKKIKEVYLYTHATIKMTVTPPGNSAAGDGGSSIFFPFEFSFGVRVPLDY
ncbi:MAG: hypothetical protein P1U44_10470 [Vicingaceae bacterium]|nr:hypothetical protein [Flavobacteriales bacterium]MDF1676129.1 hypothetical protein [Vicingaceae bacterium]|tara:strand:+ start:15210 stop:15887 length:678 start_codon:yes stop_codon:yes gene_type:complete